ncbi:MAG: hypothetical protein IPJ35_07320 [Elusimicrobia bacterium]|nr:hypothetical protein [Elusimicrobiota bacterium]
MRVGREVAEGLKTGLIGLERTVRDVTVFNAAAYGIGGAINTAVGGSPKQFFGGLINIPTFGQGMGSGLRGARR